MTADYKGFRNFHMKHTLAVYRIILYNFLLCVQKRPYWGYGMLCLYVS